ncbi:proteinase inhibitor [Ephemerocybe angulata]|uniref:Proteinase inhibitor n=1 Tax=Ephemerocybe angulata TaxID=980116 RepID=A0A8H6HXH6_9AGAR|nr:proteinase inhibitor [Tulosesus angulatus]
MEALTTGQYLIVSLANKLPVGRALREDRSLNPKKIITLPRDEESPRWVIEKDWQEGAYKISIRGGTAIELNGLLFAGLIPDLPNNTWKIESQPQHGKSTYTISLAGDGYGKGWVVPGNVDEEGTQLAVRPLIVQPSYPPRYPPFELFEITRLGDDDY